MTEQRKRRRARRWYPDQLTVRMRRGIRARVEEAADAEGIPPAQFVREAVDRALEAARKRQAHAAAQARRETAPAVVYVVEDPDEAARLDAAAAEAREAT